MAARRWPTARRLRTGRLITRATTGTWLEPRPGGRLAGLGLLGLSLGYLVYSRRTKVADTMRGLAGGWPYRILLNKYYVDEAYDGAIIRPGFRFSRTVLWKGVDAGVIDGLLVNGSALVVAVIGSLLRLLQNGLVRFYAWSFTVGVAVFVVYLSLKG